jgi:hypothetical protein
VAGFFKQAKNKTTMNNQKLVSSVKYIFQETRAAPKIDHWSLSHHNNDGHDIYTNPVTGAQLHFDDHDEIYMMQMVCGFGDDRSLDGIVSMSVGTRAGGTSRIPGGTIAVEGRTEDMDTLKVSECYPVFAEVEGSTTVFRVYTFGYMMKLCEEIGLRQEDGPSFIFMFDYRPDLFTLPGTDKEMDILPGVILPRAPDMTIRNLFLISQSGPLEYLRGFLPTVGAGLGDGMGGAGIGDGTAGAAERG